MVCSGFRRVWIKEQSSKDTFTWAFSSLVFQKYQAYEFFFFFFFFAKSMACGSFLDRVLTWPTAATRAPAETVPDP